MIDVIVVGAGHAGIEAAHITAKMGEKTLLLTMNINNIADMACNPSIGGTSKGVIVREVDALGGLMGRVTDVSHFQIKMLNKSKGAAVRALRAQVDKVLYPKKMLEELNKVSNLELREGKVEDLIIEDKKVLGVILDNGEKIYSKIVILTTGTYTKSNILIGDESIEEGPHGEDRSNHLTDNLKKEGINILRLKTGTPPRIKDSSIDFTNMIVEKGDDELYTFSFDTIPSYDPKNQRDCYLIYTHKKTHDLINENIEKSAMYSGLVTGTGARYCPSIEDKLVKFSDKERHQIFLEPESNYTDEWYLQGFSTSLPRDIQEKMVHSLPGLENAEILKYAYAIEYDAIDPIQIYPSLENKLITNLFTAGQINGTSGYEEAAGQGIMAGINAVLKLNNEEPFILKRSEAYIGVMIDDLVTKGTVEPYRMLTSRAEYRLLLRHDNADLRLREYAKKYKTISDKQYDNYLNKLDQINNLKKELKSNKIKVKNNNITLYDYVKRPNTSIFDVANSLNNEYSKEILDIVEIEIKYSGYIKKQEDEINKLKKLEEKEIPKDINYFDIKNIAIEARQKLDMIKPKTIAQASRISGVNPADIAVLSIYLKKEYNKDE